MGKFSSFCLNMPPKRTFKSKLIFLKLNWLIFKLLLEKKCNTTLLSLTNQLFTYLQCDFTFVKGNKYCMDVGISHQFSFTHKITPTLLPTPGASKFYIMIETCLFTCLTDVGKPAYSLISHYCISLLVLDFLQTTNTEVALCSSHIRFNSFFT